MTRTFHAAAVGLFVAFLTSCSGGSAPTAPSNTSADAVETGLIPTAVDPADLPALSGGAVLDAAGTSSGAIGLYWLTRDPNDPLTAQLEPGRSVAAQGDLYALSLRPYMGPTHLALISSVAGPNNTTDYTVRFQHPFAMPADLTRPHSVSKRVDLFVNDVNLVLAVSGADLFYGNTVKTNTVIMPNASGYRMLGPLVNTASLSVGGGTNVFPYRLLSLANHAQPAGNYDAVNGWRDGEFLTPTGYDIVPQGGIVTTTMRLANIIVPPLPMIVVVKYQDPRAGVTGAQKRANRLPDPTNPAACRYFMPEGAGDMQSLAVTVTGEVVADSSSVLAQVDVTLLDWDNASTVAGSFPNHSNLNQISEASGPNAIELSIPQLRAASPFVGTKGSSSGLINEFLSASIVVNNIDRTYVVVSPAGDTLNGLLRIRDSQDYTNPVPQVLDESLVVQTLPSTFELSTRYQLVPVVIAPAAADPAPDLTSVTPLSGLSGAVTPFSAVNSGGPVTTWNWNFGGGAVPNTSASATPSVTLGAPGVYNGTVNAISASGSDAFPFTLTVLSPAPNLTTVSPLNGGVGTSRTFTATNTGGAVVTWSWNFGGGAAPNTSSAASPTVTLGGVGTYSCSVMATNASGSSNFPFSLSVTTGSPPTISAVNFTALNGLRASTASATSAGSPTSWSWNFGGGATPNTSTSTAPSLTLGNPGAYSGTVTATNAFGSSSPFPFTLNVGYKSIGMRIRVIKSGTTLPKKLYNMPASGWSLANANAWITSNINPVFMNTATRFDTSLTDYAEIDNPTLFNIDTTTEENSLWSLVLGQSSSKVNVFVINSQPMDPGLGGVMSDTGCNHNNSGRGCYIITFNSAWDQQVLPHELGHVMDLPHIRTVGPYTSANYNLMSYGPISTALSTNISREGSAGCNIWSGNPMNQFSVVNNWVWQYM